MRLSKKILATLLPLTAAGALAPTLSSCNKGSSFDIAYGDSINCISGEYDKTVTGYRSIGDIQWGVKGHTSIETSTKLEESKLPKWDDTEIDTQQKMYYDLIASLAFSRTPIISTETKDPIPFTLIWKWNQTHTELTITLQYKDGETVKPAAGTYLGYANKNGAAYIQILDDNEAVKYEVRSYNFQNTTIEG